MIRVILADDHKIFRQGVKQLLCAEDDIDVIGEAANCKDAYDLICDEIADVAILDLMMPDGSGIDVLRNVKKQKLKTKIIILTMQNDVVTASSAIKLGVDGYLSKDSAYEDLLNVIKKVLSDEIYISPSIAGKINKFESRIMNKLTGLTKRETEILRHIAKGKTNREIGLNLHISIKTVDTHRTNIMKKLDIHRTADLVRYAIENGFDRETDF